MGREVELLENTYKGMANIGFKPTVNADKTLSFEVNIFDFDQDIYGKSVRVKLVSKVRDEIKFANIDELKKQLSIDKEKIQNLFKV